MEAVLRTLRDKQLSLHSTEYQYGMLVWNTKTTCNWGYVMGKSGIASAVTSDCGEVTDSWQQAGFSAG